MLLSAWTVAYRLPALYPARILFSFLLYSWPLPSFHFPRPPHYHCCPFVWSSDNLPTGLAENHQVHLVYSR